MQRNPSVVPYRNGMPMWHLYQDIFEGHGAIDNFAFHFASTYIGAGLFDDVSFDDDNDTSSRSIGKGKSTGRGRWPMERTELVDAVKELL